MIDPEKISTLSGEDPRERLRYEWLSRLSLPKLGWDELATHWGLGSPEARIHGLIPDALAIERVRIEDFHTRRHARCKGDGKVERERS